MNKESKRGAWFLLCAVLLFGAMVWGYGGISRDEERKNNEFVQAINDSVEIVENIPEVRTEKKKTEKRNSTNKQKIKTNKNTGRDIVGDDIECKANEE